MPSENMAVLTPIPRPSEKRRNDQRRIAAETPGSVYKIAPEVFEEGEAPEIKGLFSDDGGLPRGMGFPCSAASARWNASSVSQIFVKTTATEEFQEETAHGLPRKYALNRTGKTSPGLLLFGNKFAAPFCDRVILRFAVVIGKAPFGGNGAIEFQAVERRVERTFFHFEHLVRKQVDGLRNGVTVQGAALQRVENQEIERALEQCGLSGFGHRLLPCDDLGELFAQSPRDCQGERRYIRMNGRR